MLTGLTYKEHKILIQLFLTIVICGDWRPAITSFYPWRHRHCKLWGVGHSLLRHRRASSSPYSRPRYRSDDSSTPFTIISVNTSPLHLNKMAPKRNKQSEIFKQRQKELRRVRTYTAVYNIPSVPIWTSELLSSSHRHMINV